MIDGGVIAERLETLVLARLSTLPKKGPTPTPDQLADGLRSYAPPTLDDRQWRELVSGALQRLRDQQLVTAQSRFAGAEELKRRIGAHSAKDWKRWSGKLLPALALGVPPNDAKANKRLTGRNAWCAAIAGRALGIWVDGAPPSLGATCDALIWRELGIEGAPKMCPAAVRAHFLRRHVASELTAPDQLVRQIAVQAIGALNVSTEAILAGLVRAWLTGRELGGAATRAAPETAARADASAAVSLIDAVRSAAQRAHEGVFGDRKVFISSVWDAVRSIPPWSSLALDDFKARLVAAHRNRELVLARADLVAAMDPALVASSETRTDGATFHFVVREPVR